MSQLFRSLLLVGLIFIVSSFVAKGQKPESVLWEISGKNLKRSSYLLGTYHNAPYKTFTDFPKLKSLIKQCEFGILEKDENSIGDVADAAIVTPPLDSIFTPKEYALVDSFFTDSPFGSIKPHNNEASPEAMFQVVMMLKQKNTQKQAMQFDDYVHRFLRDSLKRKTFGLDEPRQMAKEAAKTDYRRTAELIVYAISHDFDVNSIVPKSVFDFNLYVTSLKSDMKLHKNLGNSEMEEAVRGLTIERNQLWLPKIISKANEASCFIAVGLGHLQYQTGLIQLLRREGYTLKPVKLKKRRL